MHTHAHFRGPPPQEVLSGVLRMLAATTTSFFSPLISAVDTHEHTRSVQLDVALELPGFE